ncbi:MAG: beta-ketoacyl-[acyl-carrier-protein] synthase family protein [Acidobacteriota bacterium]|nr:beta-ketoacyl-[acyl-carrier-protein] synthase family protein [Acidobacteriota bacterium]
MNRRVVVTGVGLVSCLGHEYESVLEALRAGKSAVRRMTEWRADLGLESRVAGAVDHLEEKKAAARLPKKLVPAMSDAALFCCLAARDAVADAGLEPGQLADPRTGCIVGSGVGSIDSVWRAAELYLSARSRRIDPYTVLRCMSSSASAAVASLLAIRGRSYSIASACATSAHNIGHAFELIRQGRLDRAVAGGGEDVSELVAVAFQALRLALSTSYNDVPEQASRPFDQGRDGFVMGGGGGIVVLEELGAARARGARIRAEILGFGANSDGFDLVLPEPEGDQAAACMRLALDDAEVEPSRIDYVNTHGTSTRHGDVAELKALRQVFGRGVPPFSSTKSMTGHPIGAAGALELIFCIGMLERGFVAPSINVTKPDPAVADLPLVTAARELPLATVLSSSFGFGGTNGVLVVGRFDD